MKHAVPKSAKESYQRMRLLGCRELWEQVLGFEELSPKERLDQVGLIRAIGVVMAESGTEADRQKARAWLLALLKDPQEKIRRYAMAALPKLGASLKEESALLGLLKETEISREKQFLERALEKIGGESTLASLEENLPAELEQKLKANIARKQSSSIRLEGRIAGGKPVVIHLHCRAGLEEFLREEVLAKKGPFRLRETRRGLVVVENRAPFTLGELYEFRCFATLGFPLGFFRCGPGEPGKAGVEKITAEVAPAVASEHSRSILGSLTQGPPRYRLNFCHRAAPSSLLRGVAARIYQLSPQLLNDSRSAPWSVDVFETQERSWVELRPRISPDPRLFYRKADIPAASHPPLAASMVRLGGVEAGEVVWDPFCGSGLELIERCLKGKVRRAYGTDLSRAALEAAKANFSAAGVEVEAEFACCDFRDFAGLGRGRETIAEKGLERDSVSLILTNPPLGKRVPIADLRGLIGDLLRASAIVLKKGGRLVFANPLPIGPADCSLQLEKRTVVDFGGFNCRLEKYVKQ